MRIDGLWRPDETQTWCPTISGFVVIAGREYPVPFLVDTGAAQTVLGSDFASALQPYQVPSSGAYLTSVAGEVNSFYATVRLCLIDTTGRKIYFNLNCAVLTDPHKRTRICWGATSLTILR